MLEYFYELILLSATNCIKRKLAKINRFLDRNLIKKVKNQVSFQERHNGDKVNFIYEVS